MARRPFRTGSQISFHPLSVRRFFKSAGVADFAVMAIIFAGFVLIAHGARQAGVPLLQIELNPISLSPWELPGYALRTTLRMAAGILASLLFTFLVAPLAANNRRAEMVVVPALDILQSVPVLGFLSFTVVFFLGLFPGSVLGAECAAVFAIFTSQAWNMALSFYQSLKTLPTDLVEASRSFRLSPWRRFWTLDAPFAVPGLVWNTMLSASGGWFFIVAAEAISVGSTTIKLPGIGSYIALAIEQQDLIAIGWAIAMMLVVILIYDQIVFRPAVAWAEKFRFEQTGGNSAEEPWMMALWRRARIVRLLVRQVGRAWHAGTGAVTGMLAGVLLRARKLSPLRMRSVPRLPHRVIANLPRPALSQTVMDRLWTGLLGAVVAFAIYQIGVFVGSELSWRDVGEAFVLGLITLLRVVVLTALASLVWVPVGIWIGLRPALATRIQPLAQFLAAFPANLLFPIAVVAIVRYDLTPDIWLSPLMIFGTQWYILFNVVAGASAYPNDLREAASSFRIHGWRWWTQVMLPGIFPYYVTGAMTATGGCWNAAIVSEVASWGQTKLAAHGLGAYIAQATDKGDYPRIVLGVALMSLFVILVNRLFWSALFETASRRYRLG